MESDSPSPGGINGINLANYFPNRRSYNTVVYFHKKFLPGKREESIKDIKTDQKPDKVKCKKKKSSNNVKRDKSQQFNSETVNQQSFKYETVEMAPYNNAVLEQTIRFAKNLVPVVIPPLKATSSSPVVYTVKTLRKHRKHDKKCECNIEKDVTYNKDLPKKYDVNENRKRHKGNYSARYSIEPTSQNTLDDIHIDINQSCSFSESTEVNFKRREQSNMRISNENYQKFFVSNSFEALATESIADGNKIKIHLMNDTDKAQFRESITNPIINTVSNYLSHINNENNALSINLSTVQKGLQRNEQKLEYILDKLSCIEQKIESHATQSDQSAKTLRVQSAKASKLEELGQDILEVKEHDVSEEEDLTEEYNNMLKRRRNRGKSVVVAVHPREAQEKKDEKKNGSLGCGEDVPGPNDNSFGSQLGIKPERPNRIPARFCWTDADRKK